MNMQFSEMKDVDIKLSLLSGSDVKVGNLKIPPYTLREINEYGYSIYRDNLQWMSLSVEDFLNSIFDLDKKVYLEEIKSSLKSFDFYVKFGGADMRTKLIDSLSMVFKTKDILFIEENIIAIGFIGLEVVSEDENGQYNADIEKLKTLDDDDLKIIDRDNFDDIIRVVKLQNYLEKPELEEDEEIPADEEARKLQEHMKKMREKVKNKKKAQQEDSGEDEIDISDIISAVSSKSNSINKLNIWDFTIYQIYDEYSRLELIENYSFSTKAMLAGAKDIDISHWSSKL